MNNTSDNSAHLTTDNSGTSNYMEKLLEQYSNSFDITRNYTIGDTTAYAYGFYSSLSDKYVLTPKANLWSIKGFEHILFFCGDVITEADIANAKKLMENEMSDQLVCKGNRYPEKDHMYSYVTVAFICSSNPDDEVIKSVTSYKYEKNYLFTFRGHVEGHMILMDLSSGRAYANKAAKHLVEYYQNIK
jgi:hypothetical protein